MRQARSSSLVFSLLFILHCVQGQDGNWEDRNCFVTCGGGLNIAVSAVNCVTCQAVKEENNCASFTFPTNGGPALTSCPATGSGDPHFEGFNGSPFEYHGHDGVFVNVYSDATLQVNSELSSFGIHGKTFMKSIGVKTYPSCHYFKFTSIPTVDNGTWIAYMESYANGEVYNGSDWTSAEGSVKLKHIASTDGSFEVMLSTPSVLIGVRKEQASLHLDLSMQLLTIEAPPNAHGILGQTLGWAPGEASLVGDETSYIVSGLFDNDFAFNIFHATCV